MGERARSEPEDLGDRMQRVLQEVGRRFDLPTGDAELVRLHSNALFILPSQEVVVRIATNPKAGPRVRRSVAVTRWLAERGFPCTTPVMDYDQPVEVHGHAVTLWRYEKTAGTPAHAAELGTLLRELHAHLLPDGNDIAELGDPLASVADALHARPEAIAPGQHAWLAGRITELRVRWETVRFPHPPALIHGDAHPNNLMRRTSGTVILGDWDQVSYGPREWDLVQVHYTHRRFARPDAAELDRFAAAYGWDVRQWSGLELLIQVREVRGLSAFIRTAAAKPSTRDELAHRLHTLQHGHRLARWSPPSAL